MSLLSLPDQTIPDSEKNKDWHISHALEYATYSISDHYNDQRKEMLKLYRAYNAELSIEERELAKRITCPNGRDLGIEYVVYPLIQTKIEQIIGEFLLRPLRRKTYVIDKKSKNAKYEQKLSVLSEQIMRDLSQKVQTELGFTPQTENPEMEIPEDVEEFFEKDFKMLAEETADGILNLFLDVRKEKNKFKQLFLDFCITDRAHVVLDKKHGHTTIRKIHPLDADYDIDPYKIVQDDHEYLFENYYLTENEIYNSFDLNKEQKEIVKSQFNLISNIYNSAHDSEELSSSQKYDGWYQTNNKIGRLRVISAMWKSRKRVSIKVSENKKGKQFHKKIDDTYKERKGDVIEHIDGEEPRYVLMLGPDLCLEWGLMKQRHSYVDAPWSCTLPCLSIIRDNSTGSSLIKSVAAKLYQLQEIASEVLFEIRLALKHAGDSRVMVYDVAQTPKAFTKGGYENGLNRVMHHIKKDKLMFINSKEKHQQRNTFNQFTSLDLSQKGAIQDLFNGLAIIEDLASKFVGITPEREGQVGQYQTASGTDKAIRGSAARTEVIYTPFDEFIQALLEKVLLKAKADYEEGEVVQYVFGEMKTKFLKIYKEFNLADLGLYLSDARKDKQASENIDRAAEMALSNANTPDMVMGLIEVFEGETAVEKKAVFQRMLNSMEKLRAEQAKAEQEALQAESQQKSKEKAIDTQLTREGHDKDITVAEIYANNKATTEGIKTQSMEKIQAAKMAEERNKNNKKE